MNDQIEEREINSEIENLKEQIIQLQRDLERLLKVAESENTL